MKNILNYESQIYSIKSNDFEGPLDLLCHLIDKNKMDICDINISDITDQYIQYLNKMEELDLEIASEFLIMASTLLYLKSKTLLPVVENVEEEDEKELTEEELLRRIIEYKKYKEITKNLRECVENNSKKIFKNPEIIELPKQKLEATYTKEIISEMYKNIIEKNAQKLNQNAKNIEQIAITDTYTVESKLKIMFKELIRSKKFVFNKLFPTAKCNRKELMTAFSGLLELSRRSKVITQQEELFGDITVEKAKKTV